ncbi:hypothetical protein [Pseudomonas aeruginosa]|uniref:hypothetical protein n=1 Tax=Pseudomonas aeruginosa TaxID=287 RepID=UPI0013CE1E7E|nr:hypothetical protein [Pseudomonas aeruginosa]
MQHLKKTADPHYECPHKAYASLACLSPVGGPESSIIVVVVTSMATAYAFAGALQPVIGGAGALILMLVGALLFDRAIRPLVLWAIGWRVYRSIMLMGGKRAADHVVRIYSQGGTLNRSQFDALLIQAGNLKCKELEG